MNPAATFQASKLSLERTESTDGRTLSDGITVNTYLMQLEICILRALMNHNIQGSLRDMILLLSLIYCQSTLLCLGQVKNGTLIYVTPLSILDSSTVLFTEEAYIHHTI